MRYIDYAFAWLIFATAVGFMIAIEIFHLRNAILDIPFLWLLVAMVNFLRLRSGYARVPGLMVTCVSANIVGLVLEGTRWRLFGSGIWKNWGPFTFIAAVAFLAEAILSVVRRNDPGSR